MSNRSGVWRVPSATILGVAALAVTANMAVAGTTPDLSFQASPVHRPATATGPLAALELTPAPLILDDGTSENDVGLIDSSNNTSTQFLWFNRFSPGSKLFPFQLERVEVLFDPTIFSGVNVGDAIQIVIYQDDDGDPSNGAALLAAFNATVQVTSLTQFSVYPLPTPIVLTHPTDILIGVVSRFVQSGVTPITFPAAIDQTSSQRRSWVAAWSGDPPDPPLLPADAMAIIDDVNPNFAGNWMIRGFGGRIDPSAPVLSPGGLVALVVLLCAVAWFFPPVRRSRVGSRARF